MSSSIKRFILPLLLCLLPIASAQETVVERSVVNCPDGIQDAAGENLTRITCSRLLVPENRQTPENGRRVDLFVVRIHAETEKGNAPILHLAGGPGDAASAEVGFWLASSFQQDHDIILVDQRGTGYSLPSLDCPEYGDVEGENWIRACRQRLVGEGVDLSHFHHLSVVWDTYELLVRLELEEVNLYGNSYGSRLALLLAEIAPERIRSMALDGVYPPPRNDVAELASNSARALERLFADCEADAACQALYPHLRDMFYRVIAEMNAAPPELYHLGESTGWTLNGDQYLAWTVGVLRYKDAIPILPTLTAAFDAGVFDLFVLIDGFVKMPYWNALDFRSEGFELSVRCSEDARLAGTQRDGAQESVVSDAIARVLNPIVQRLRDQCALWDVPAAPEMISQAITSDVPALLLSGAYDPATPPHWADFAAAHLSRGWHFVFPNVGHGVLDSDECAAELMRVFLADPLTAPIAECFAQLGPPAFVEPEHAGG